METDAVDGGKKDQMRVRDLDGCGVEIGRVVQVALIAIATRMVDWRRLGFSIRLQT